MKKRIQKLTLHRETRELPVDALIVGKNGPKLKEADEAPAAPAAENDPAKTSAAKDGGKETVAVTTPELEVVPRFRTVIVYWAPTWA